MKRSSRKGAGEKVKEGGRVKRLSRNGSGCIGHQGRGQGEEVVKEGGRVKRSSRKRAG